jgi:hypothetical protein
MPDKVPAHAPKARLQQLPISLLNMRHVTNPTIAPTAAAQNLAMDDSVSI